MARTAFSAHAAKEVEGSVEVKAAVETAGSRKRQSVRARGRKNMNLQQRIALFESDEWASNATKNKVNCVGCGKKIKLDKRTPFNYEPFEKHKRRCQHIKLEENNRRGEPGSVFENMASNNFDTLATRDINLDENEVKLTCYDSLSISYGIPERIQTWSLATLEAAKTLLLLVQADQIEK